MKIFDFNFVQFFWGIKETRFGLVCFQTDWLLKKIGNGVERIPVKDLQTYYGSTPTSLFCRKNNA